MGDLQALILPVVLAGIGAAAPGLMALWQTRHQTEAGEKAAYYRDIRDEVDELRERLEHEGEHVSDLDAYIDDLQARLTKVRVAFPPKPRRKRFTRAGEK